MDVLINLIVVTLSLNIYINHQVVHFKYNFICYLYLSKARERKKDTGKGQDNEVRTADYMCACVCIYNIDEWIYLKLEAITIAQSND